MRDKFFDIADTAAETFAKLVLLLLFGACTIFLMVDAAPVGIVFFFVVLSFARWVWAKPSEADDQLVD